MGFGAAVNHHSVAARMIYFPLCVILCPVSAQNSHTVHTSMSHAPKNIQLECGPMPKLMVALPNIGGALCSTPQSLADAHY